MPKIWCQVRTVFFPSLSFWESSKPWEGLNVALHCTRLQGWIDCKCWLNASRLSNICPHLRQG